MRGVAARSRKVSRPPFTFLHFFSETVEGIGQGRVTRNLGTFVKEISGALHISDEKSISMVYELLDTEGLYVGASSALNVVAAVELAQKLGPGMFQTCFDGSTFTCFVSGRLQGGNCVV